MNKIFITYLRRFFIFLICAFCFKISYATHYEYKKISIVTTLFPLYDFVKNIGGEKVEVILLLSPGVDAHNFEPKPSDILTIIKANIFIYTGKYMEPWVEKFIVKLDSSKIKIIDASENIVLLQKKDFSLEGKCSNHKHFHDHALEYDPHIWLDFDNAKKIVDDITKALVELDFDNSDFYKNNAKKYKNRLTYLDNLYKDRLFKCSKKEIIYGGHYAFGYLAKRYGLRYIASQGFSQDSEPSALKLIEMIKEMKDKKIKYIFYEELSSPKIAETIANETNAELLLLNSVHNISKLDYENNVSYISIMEKNLQNLCIGLS